MKTEKQLQLVTFEQALRLSRLGFDWATDAFYHSDGVADIYVFQNHNAEGKISAPTVALALKWMRDNEEAGTCLANLSGEATFVCCINDIESMGCLETYEQAESVLLDELLTILENNN